ncbi:MAG TPA: NEW3 domain-containing protein, partial [Thermoanaerobaculia bacterium]|nr:NEW3 domain-containing protein [Thermoanaerobaculia bacterium]
MRKFLLALFLTSTALFAQSGISEAERRLDLARAELNERQAAASLEQTKRLHAEGLASQSDLNRAIAEHDRTLLDTEKARVGLANDLPSFQVLSAVKEVSPSSETRVVLRLRELERGYGDAGFVRSYLISIASGTTIIGEPYQREVRLGGRGGRELTLTFRLLRDADEVTIQLLSGTRRETIPILLQRDQSEHRVQLTSANPSQDGTLGSKVEYWVQLERFASRPETLGLAVEGLAPGFTSEWIDSSTGARISGVGLAENQTSTKLLLRVFLPPEGEGSWLGATMPLHVSATDASGTAMGKLDLQLRPIGAPKLVLSSDNLLVPLSAGKTKIVALSVENIGAADAHDVRLEANLPIGIEAKFVPASLDVLRVREKRSVRVELTAAQDVVPAEYNLKVQARTESRLAYVASPELSFRVDVRSGIALGGT